MSKYKVEFSFSGAKFLEAKNEDEAHDKVREWLQTASLNEVFADYEPDIDEIIPIRSDSIID